MILNDSKVWLYSEPTDMRKAIDGLSLLVAESMDMNPSNGELFIFFNKKYDKLKILYWHINGFVVLYKRFEKDFFQIPTSLTVPMEISTRELSWLLDGLDFSNIEGHKKLQYTNFY